MDWGADPAASMKHSQGWQVVRRDVGAPAHEHRDRRMKKAPGRAPKHADCLSSHPRPTDVYERQFFLCGDVRLPQATALLTAETARPGIGIKLAVVEPSRDTRQQYLERVSAGISRVTFPCRKLHPDWWPAAATASGLPPAGTMTWTA